MSHTPVVWFLQVGPGMDQLLNNGRVSITTGNGDGCSSWGRISITIMDNNNNNTQGYIRHHNNTLLLHYILYLIIKLQEMVGHFLSYVLDTSLRCGNNTLCFICSLWVQEWLSWPDICIYVYYSYISISIYKDVHICVHLFMYFFRINHAHIKVF